MVLDKAPAISGITGYEHVLQFSVKSQTA